jgi:tRNA1Val (adenine37-N6)-methyltransferase
VGAAINMRKNPVFRFKQFTIAQDNCVMKVNTDGVLLGAWATIGKARRMLDIGTGTGVLALMLAQKNSEASVDAIDIDDAAVMQAGQNFAGSIWHQRMMAYNLPLQEFFPGMKYDVIISNPPYFIDDLKAADERKNIARHTTALSYEELLGGIKRLLAPKGTAFIVLPFFNLAAFEYIANQNGLFFQKVTEVIAVAGRTPYLALIELKDKEDTKRTDSLTIQQENGEYTEQYITTTREFYLKF